MNIMETMLYRYGMEEEEYLVFDMNANASSLGSRAVRAICARNCGIGARGILVGPVKSQGRDRMLFYLPDGTLSEEDPAASTLAARYLQEKGYAWAHSQGDRCDNLKRTGVVFLSEDFFRDFA